MGNKTISVIIMLVLLCSGITAILSTSSLGYGKDELLGSRTKDNDNSFGTATELFNNSLIKGTLDTDDDEYDYFKINLRRVGRNGDELNTKLTITSASGLIIMALVNTEFYPIGDSYCMTSFTNPVERTFIACDAGYYYIILIGIFANPGTNINYDLEVNFSLIQRNIDTDNINASANTATSGITYSNSINPTWDYLDLYNIQLTAGATVTQGLTVELLNTDDKYLAVYNPDGTLREFSDIIFGDPDDKEIIKFAADVTGTYRIAVGISGEPVGIIPYQLTPTITSGVPHDDDFDEEHATRVYNGTRLNMSFDSEFDVYDYYVMQLNSSDNLTVSMLFIDDVEADLNIEIYESGEWPINLDTYWETDGMWTFGIAENDQTDYFIMVENYNTSIIFDYEIWFSLNGENVLFWDEPMGRNSTNLDFSMLEDSMDDIHVKLSKIFYDLDSPLTFGSPSHLIGKETNISVEILANSTVKFTPAQDYNGYEIITFNATDINSEVLEWDLNVTIVPVNDAPVLEDITEQTWTQGTTVNLQLNITDVDDTVFTITDNTTLFDVDQVNQTIKFIPTNAQVGTYHINVNVTDGELNDSAFFLAQIKNVNDPPVLVRVGGKNPVPDGAVEFDATEDQWNNYTLEVSDIDHDIGVQDVFTFMVNTTDTAFMIDEQTGNISFFPLQEHVGFFNATINVTDGNGGLAEQNLSFTVKNVNDAPEKPEIKLINKTDLNISCSVDEVFDEDGDILTYSWDFGDNSTTINLGRNVNHSYADPGEYNVLVTVTDPHGGVAMDSLLVNVTVPKKDGDDKNGKNDTNGNVTIIDIDDDGLDDLWEILNFGDLEQNATSDYDKDGFTDLQEFENKSNPTDKSDTPKKDKDDKKDDDDDGPSFALPSGPEAFMYITGIIAIINLILIIIIIFFIMMRKKRAGEPGEGRAPWSEEKGERFTVPCPECGQMVDEYAKECPYCGEEIDLGERAEDYPEEEDWEAEGRGRPRGAKRARGAREPEYDEEESEWEPEEEEDWEEEEYYEEGEEPEEEWDEEEYYEEGEEPEEGEEWDEESDEEYYEEGEEPEEEWDEKEYYEDEEPDEEYDEGEYDDRYSEDKRYREDNYRPSDSWGRQEEKPAWDSGRGRRGYRR